jgi:hypothetical protein
MRENKKSFQGCSFQCSSGSDKKSYQFLAALLTKQNNKQQKKANFSVISGSQSLFHHSQLVDDKKLMRMSFFCVKSNLNDHLTAKAFFLFMILLIIKAPVNETNPILLKKNSTIFIFCST